MSSVLPQILVNIFIATGIYTLVAIGFSLNYQTSRFFNFAYGAILVVGAYGAYTLTASHIMPPLPGICFGILFAALVGCVIELVVYRPLRLKGVSSLVLLLASLGIYLVIQNLISLIFGDDTKMIRSGPVKPGIQVLGARITGIQVATIVVSIVLLVAVGLILAKTRFGKAIRALANDPELAYSLGIPVDKLILVSFAVASALAGIAGIFLALNIDLNPTMGLNALMMGVVVTVVSGIGRISGLVFGALLVSTAQQLGAWQFQSQWEQGIAFAILVIFLILRPQGIFGQSLTTSSV